MCVLVNISITLVLFFCKDDSVNLIMTHWNWFSHCAGGAPVKMPERNQILQSLSYCFLPCLFLCRSAICEKWQTQHNDSWRQVLIEPSHQCEPLTGMSWHRRPLCWNQMSWWIKVKFIDVLFSLVSFVSFPQYFFCLLFIFLIELVAGVLAYVYYQRVSDYLLISWVVLFHPRSKLSKHVMRLMLKCSECCPSQPMF